MVLNTIFLSSNTFAEDAIPKDSVTLSVFEYPPFLMENAEDYGIEPAIVKLAFESRGITVKFVFVPPARAIEMAKLGQVDGTLGWVHSEERESIFYFSEIIASAPLVFFHLKDNPIQWKSYEDLKGKLIGTVNKFYYGPAFHLAQENGLIQMEAVSDDLLNLKKLVAERIDITPISLFVGYHLANHLYGKQAVQMITHNPVALKISEHHLLLPKALDQSRVRLSLFNQGLDAIKHSGEYQAVLDYYAPAQNLTENASMHLASKR